MAADKGNKKKGDRISKLLYLIYLLGLLLGVAIIFNIVKIQVGFNPPQRILSEIKTRNKRVPIEPRRGQILASDGRVLAMSYTLYTIAMDCTVMRDIYKSDKKKGAGREEEWRGKARKFSEGLAKYLPKKDAASYYRTIINNRNRNIRYWKIADDVDNRTLEALRKLPLFNEGKYKGGVFFEKYHVRKYPYGSLGRRAIGLVNNNAENENKSHNGLEGRFEYILHGTPGYEWMREADGAYLVHNFDSSSLAPKNGQDVRSTLDVDIQDMLDKSLRKRLSETDNVEGGCGMVIDVRTGAIRAMVNLRKEGFSRVRVDGRARISGSGLLVNRHRWRKTVNRVKIWLVHLSQELTGIAGQGLNVAALSLCVNGVKGKTRLTRTRKSRNNYQLIKRDININVLQVVLSCTTDSNFA